MDKNKPINAWPTRNQPPEWRQYTPSSRHMLCLDFIKHYFALGHLPSQVVGVLFKDSVGIC